MASRVFRFRPRAMLPHIELGQIAYLACQRDQGVYIQSERRADRTSPVLSPAPASIRFKSVHYAGLACLWCRCSILPRTSRRGSPPQDLRGEPRFVACLGTMDASARYVAPADVHTLWVPRLTPAFNRVDRYGGSDLQRTLLRVHWL